MIDQSIHVWTVQPLKPTHIYDNLLNVLLENIGRSKTKILNSLPPLSMSNHSFCGIDWCQKSVLMNVV